jgi:hypothetical protein
MSLLISLIKRAGVATPVADAHHYCTVVRKNDNTALGDITQLAYTNVQRAGNKWLVIGKQADAQPLVFNTEIEARANILRRFW